MASCRSQSHPSQSHPCALRTAIITRRISFQVCALSITELGNMQPSQQMCANAFVGFPASSRIQAPASRTMSSLPFGSVAGSAGPSCRGNLNLSPCRRSGRHGNRKSRGAALAPSRDRHRQPSCLRPIEIGGKQTVFGSVVSHSEQHRVRHVGLKADGVRHVPAISSNSTFRRQLCIPPQQISPSAASRSPKPSAMTPASRKVFAILFVLRSGSLAHSTPVAESMRMTP